MPTPTSPPSESPGAPTLRAPFARLVRAGLACGVVDGLWAVMLTLLYGRSQLGLWQGIAATPFGPRMLDLGLAGAALRSPWLRRTLASTPGKVGLASVYGPAIWCVMSFMVIPLLTGRPTTITWRWWVQIPGHALFVGTPIVWSVAREPSPGPLKRGA